MLTNSFQIRSDWDELGEDGAAFIQVFIIFVSGKKLRFFVFAEHRQAGRKLIE
jgi:hypothetical protein